MKYEKALGFMGFVLIIAFISPVLGTLFGAFAGWLVGIFFGDTILDFLSRVGVRTDGLSMWQAGAALGFIGGYLKTTIHQKS